MPSAIGPSIQLGCAVRLRRSHVHECSRCSVRTALQAPRAVLGQAVIDSDDPGELALKQGRATNRVRLRSSGRRQSTSRRIYAQVITRKTSSRRWLQTIQPSSADSTGSQPEEPPFQLVEVRGTTGTSRPGKRYRPSHVDRGWASIRHLRGVAHAGSSPEARRGDIGEPDDLTCSARLTQRARQDSEIPKSFATRLFGASLRLATATTSRRNSSGNALGMSTFLPVRSESSHVRSQPNLGQSPNPRPSLTWTTPWTSTGTSLARRHVR